MAHEIGSDKGAEIKRPLGRPKKIETPEILWEHFQSYKEWVKANPILEHDFVGKDGDSVHRKKQRCLTMEGFQNYLDNNRIITDVTDYFENKNDSYSLFLRTCSRIRREIREDQITGGMAGIYNPSITQRLNNLTDKSEMVVREQPLFPDGE